jgi:ribosomal protein S18 acetylase RimI-like enzyme
VKKKNMQSIHLNQPPQQNSGMTRQSDVSLEKAGPPQLGDLLPMVADFHRFEEISLSAPFREKSVEILLSDGDLGEIWLIRKSGHLIGYVVVCFGYSIEFAGRVFVIDEFYIKASERGRGAGAEVLGRLKEQFRARNVVAIQLEVNQWNERAKSLYVQSGFLCRDKYQVMAVALK